MTKFILTFCCFLSLTYSVLAVENKTSLTKAVLQIPTDSMYDKTFDYSNFSGRVTDRDATGSIVKIASESKNVKFLHSGDLVEFKIQAQPKSEYCQGYVRSIEESYFVMFVKDIAACFSNTEYFRRGSALIMHSEKLSQRVREASVYRASLIVKKNDYMKQLNKLNQDLWTFEERKIQLAAGFDRKILEIEKEKMKAIGELLTQKNDDIILQKEIISRLDNIDREFEFYRVEKEELIFDRWHLDHDLGVPVYENPEEVRPMLLEHASN